MGTIFGKPDLPPPPPVPERKDTSGEAALQRRLAQALLGNRNNIRTSETGTTEQATVRTVTKLGE